MTQLYETMYILRSDLAEDQVDQAIQRYQSILTDHGCEILETQHRGKRRLAYEINKHREGIYIQLNYHGNGDAIFQMERAMRLGEDVIRFLTLKQDPPAAPELEPSVAS